MTEQDAEKMVKALLKRVNEKDQLLKEKDFEIDRLRKANGRLKQIIRAFLNNDQGWSVEFLDSAKEALNWENL